MEAQRGQGYKYFGAAKNLPGVKELFENQGPRTVRGPTASSRGLSRAHARPRRIPPALSSRLRTCVFFPSRSFQVRRTRHQMNKAIDADYYGFRDEEDGVLEKVERVVRPLADALGVGWPVRCARRLGPVLLSPISCCCC